jgi:hypothetical protein
LQLVHVINVSTRIRLRQVADPSKLADKVRLTRTIHGPRGALRASDPALLPNRRTR